MATIATKATCPTIKKCLHCKTEFSYDDLFLYNSNNKRLSGTHITCLPEKIPAILKTSFNLENHGIVNFEVLDDEKKKIIDTLPIKNKRATKRKITSTEDDTFEAFASAYINELDYSRYLKYIVFRLYIFKFVEPAIFVYIAKQKQINTNLDDLANLPLTVFKNLRDTAEKTSKPTCSSVFKFCYDILTLNINDSIDHIDFNVLYKMPDNVLSFLLNILISYNYLTTKQIIGYPQIHSIFKLDDTNIPKLDVQLSELNTLSLLQIEESTIRLNIIVNDTISLPHFKLALALLFSNIKKLPHLTININDVEVSIPSNIILFPQITMEMKELLINEASKFNLDALSILYENEHNCSNPFDVLIKYCSDLFIRADAVEGVDVDVDIKIDEPSTSSRANKKPKKQNIDTKNLSKISILDIDSVNLKHHINKDDLIEFFTPIIDVKCIINVKDGEVANCLRYTNTFDSLENYQISENILEALRSLFVQNEFTNGMLEITIQANETIKICDIIKHDKKLIKLTYPKRILTLLDLFEKYDESKVSFTSIESLANEQDLSYCFVKSKDHKFGKDALPIFYLTKGDDTNNITTDEEVDLEFADMTHKNI